MQKRAEDILFVIDGVFVPCHIHHKSVYKERGNRQKKKRISLSFDISFSFFFFFDFSSFFKI